MFRRPLLAACGLALAGCAGAPSSGGTDPEIVDRAFARTGDCDAPETATVAFDGATVRVTGCVTGPNGCAAAALDSFSLSDGRLRAVVTTGRDAPPDAACTEALVARGYELTVDLDPGPPRAVTVVHDTPGGRETVVDDAEP